MLNLRDYQNATLEALRQGFAAGKRCQILYAPTGAGKTEMAIALLNATKQKGNKAAMILDRIILCDQTSKRLDRYNIDHGVLQAKHWRWRPYENIQVCSAQTLEKRGSFPGLNLLIVDEAHTTRQQTMDFIKNNPDVRVIGLTATPFTKGLGSVYEHVVSTVTTKELVNQGVLVPLKVFVAKEIDMSGAKKVAGEWSSGEAEKRGMVITGDIVAEWIKKTHEIFGKPEKTIVFCSGVAHGADLARKFAEQGYNFVAVSYLDDDKFKQEVITEFSKPDTEIHGLIATDILTKGFDVPDVKIGVSARPFSKSLSSHIQQMGRVMRGATGKDFALWLCLAKGSRVLTDKGLVPIDKVTLDHKIWDGTNFVTHGGAVCNGIQDVITYQGLVATEGHLVHTAEGWRAFGYCASKQIRITKTGFGRTPIWLGEDIRFTSFLVGCKAQEIYSRFVRVRNLWISKLNFFIEFAVRENQRLPRLQPAGARLSDVALQQSSSHESKMLQSFMRSIRELWCKKNRIQIFWGQRSNALDNEKFGASGIQHSCGEVESSNRQDRPVWALRTWKSTLVIRGVKSAKQTWQSICGKNAQVPIGKPRNSIFRQYVEGFLLGWNDRRAGDSTISPTIHKTKREVWDILDAGPHNRFTCEGLLVHNCHSGNYVRFRDEWEEVFEAGVQELDDGKEKAKKEPSQKEKEASKCPVCSALWPKGSDTCANCGHVRERKNKVASVAGELTELGAMSKENKQDFWSQLRWKVMYDGWREGRAAHTYKDKFGVWPRGLDDKTVKQPTSETERFIKQRLRHFLYKSRKI